MIWQAIWSNRKKASKKRSQIHCLSVYNIQPKIGTVQQLSAHITIAEFIFLCEEPRVDDVESCERYSGRAAKVALLHVAQLGNQRPVPRMRKVVSAITAGLIK